MEALKAFAVVKGRLMRSASFAILCVVSLRAQSLKSAGSQLPPLDFPRMMQPIPASAAFHDPGYFVWCGTMVQSDDGKYHLYYSRWKISLGSQAWVTSSEVAHAIGDSPTGPFVFHDVALPPRGKKYWDGLVTHNPTVHRFGKKYYLYYMGDTGDGIVMSTLNWVHRNNQRIGVAVADSPNGPWKRSNHPVIDVSSDPSAPDSLCVSNPSVTQGPDGKFRILYKAVGRKTPLPSGGPVVHMMAVSDLPTGPFHKELKVLFTVPGSAFPFEDPFFWYDAKRDLYFVIMKDNHGIVAGTGHSTLVLYQSEDASNWVKADHLLVSDLVLHWKNGSVQAVAKMERPQLLFNRSGDTVALIVAIDDGGADTYNVRIPLSNDN
jgi:hypothetical protein